MINLKTTIGLETKQVSLKDLTQEQRIFVIEEANKTGRPIEEIIKELK